jgi:DHA2 family multidrug resistance protein
MAVALMQTLDITITNVALPTIRENLGASADEGTWVVTAYPIAAIIVIPVTPWLQDRFGRKRYFAVSIVGFTLASIGCGISDTLQALIFMRVVQGLFGGGILATSQAILRDTFPPRQLGRSQASLRLVRYWDGHSALPSAVGLSITSIGIGFSSSTSSLERSRPFCC